MLCARCGAMNPDTAPRCDSCGALLTGSLATHSLVHPWFAPVAHSPFGNEPLPQQSDHLPRLQPAGDILTFTPTPEHPAEAELHASPPTNRELADYPTHIHVPAVQRNTLPTSQPGFASPHTPSDEWAEDDSYAAMYQAPPPYTPAPRGQLVTGTDGTSNVVMHQTPPITQSQTLGNVFPGPVAVHNTPQTLGNVFPGPTDLAQPQRGVSSISGLLIGAEPHPLARPLPLWAFLGSTVLGALLLAALVFLNPDWATGAMSAGIIALIGAILILIAMGVRGALGLFAKTNPYRYMQGINAALLVVLLVLTSAIGITQQAGLHTAQARYLESQHNWLAAINEYQAAGESAPASTNLARVYSEWGETLSQQQQYAQAVAHFNIVLQEYTKVTDQLTRVRKDMLATYLAWGNADVQQHDYIDATSHYDALLNLSYCDTPCQNVALPKDASAYAQLAEQQLSAQHFVLAVNAFAVLTTRFANAPEATQAQTHTDYAKALWGLGQQQLNTICTNAVKTYQQLAQQFADTPQGQLAATALQQPVTVTGHFMTPLPHGAAYAPTVFLVQGLFAGIQQFQFPPLLRKAPFAPIQSNGTFTFSSIHQGTYELVWSNDGTLHFYYANSGSTVLYTAQVGPLCTYNYGAIPEKIQSFSA